MLGGSTAGTPAGQYYRESVAGRRAVGSAGGRGFAAGVPGRQQGPQTIVSYVCSIHYICTNTLQTTHYQTCN